MFLIGVIIVSIIFSVQPFLKKNIMRYIRITFLCTILLILNSCSQEIEDVSFREGASIQNTSL